jgi:20S proteasome alpha/beta subunit
LYRKQLKDADISDETVHGLLAKPMSDFNERVKARAFIAPKTIPVELILFGFIESVPRIFYVSQKTAKVVEQDFKYAIGSGSSAATTMMEWRGISEDSSLDEVLYALYEAKRIAETGPPVGKKMTMLAFIEPDGKLGQVTFKDMPLLAEAFDQFGPKPISPDWRLPGRITGAVARSNPESTTHDSQSPPPSQE